MDVAGGAGTPDDERIVRVGHDVRARCGRQCRPPTPRHHAHLVRAIELVTREVQEHDGRTRCRREDPREVDLVHLEHGARCVGPGQRGDQARWHVGAGLVADDRVARRTEPHRDEPGRRGLAVGPGDEGHLAASAQVFEEVRVDPETGPATGDRALAATQPA